MQELYQFYNLLVISTQHKKLLSESINMFIKSSKYFYKYLQSQQINKLCHGTLKTNHNKNAILFAGCTCEKLRQLLGCQQTSKVCSIIQLSKFKSDHDKHATRYYQRYDAPGARQPSASKCSRPLTKRHENSSANKWPCNSEATERYQIRRRRHHHRV